MSHSSVASQDGTQRIRSVVQFAVGERCVPGNDSWIKFRKTSDVDVVAALLAPGIACRTNSNDSSTMESSSSSKVVVSVTLAYRG